LLLSWPRDSGRASSCNSALRSARYHHRKRWPRWLPHRAHVTSIRRMPKLRSSWALSPDSSGGRLSPPPSNRRPRGHLALSLGEFERSTAEIYGDAARAGVELQLGSHGHLASNPNPGPSPPPLGLPYPPPHTSLGIRVPTAFHSENTQRLRPPWSVPEVPPGESRGAEEGPGATEPSRRSPALCRPLVGAPAISPARETSPLRRPTRQS
jgi:hypothetical protein